MRAQGRMGYPHTKYALGWNFVGTAEVSFECLISISYVGELLNFRINAN